MKNNRLWILILCWLLSGCTVEVVYPGDGVPRLEPEQESDVSPGAESDATTGEEQVVAAEITATTLPPFQITAIYPGEGPVEGGTRVTIEGFRLETVTEVFFGDTPALEFVSLGPEAIRADSPPGLPGPVVIRVLRSDGTQASVEAGFRYLSNISVTDINPPSGPVVGGTQFQVSGMGFESDAVVLIGGRQALSVQVVNPQEIVGVAPWGAHGPADVIVSNAQAFGRLKDGFRYLSPMKASHIFPPVLGVEGGTVTVVGEGLEGVERIQIGAEDGGIIENWLGAAIALIVPPMAPGIVDVRLERGEEVQFLPESLLVSDGALEPDNEILHLTPRVGSPEGGQRCWVVMGSGGSQIEVLWGDEVVSAQAVAASVYELTVPPGNGSVAVRALGQEANAFQYRYEPDATLLEITPSSGSKFGGTRVSLRVEGLPADARFFFGPLPAEDVEQTEENRFEMTTPPGSLGPGPVRVMWEDGNVEWPGRYAFTSDNWDVFAVKPGEGAESGGTLFRIYGEGFTEGTKVYFGGQEATDVTVVSEGELMGYTPPGGSGVVDVLVETNDATETLENVFTYFNPSSSFGGTWGGALDETLNVTVLDGSNGEGVVDAFVFLGAPASYFQEGLTNELGQVTFGEIGLTGEQVVTAVKEGYTSSSVVSFDSTNVVLILYSVIPNPGDPPPPPPEPGVISGRILGTEKFAAGPASACPETLPEAGGMCLDCMTDEDCEDGYQCEAIDNGELACTLGCSESSDCDAGFRCGLIPGDLNLYCLPEQWNRDVECTLSDESFFGALSGGQVWTPATWDEAVNSFTYSLQSRPGDVAVLCRGGWRDTASGTFLPRDLGVRRHVFVQPGALLPDRDVPLEFTLGRDLDVRHDRAGVTYDAGTLYTVDVLLELGTDGWKNLGSRQTFDPFETLLVESLPTQLSGPLYDASYLVYGGIYTEDERGIPYSVAQEDDVLPENTGQIFGWEDEGWLSAAEDLEDDLFAASVTAEGTIWAVGARGLIVSGKPSGGWTPYFSPTEHHLRDVSMGSESLHVIVGDGGLILEKYGFEWVVVESPTEKDLHAVWVGEEGEAWAVGWYVVLRRSPETGWQRIDSAPPLAYEAVLGLGEGKLVLGASNGMIVSGDGTSWKTLQTDASGTVVDCWSVSSDLVFAAASGGQVMVATDGDWNLLEPLPNGTVLTSLDGHVIDGGVQLWAAGKGGAVWQYAEGTWIAHPLPTQTPIEDVVLFDEWEGPLVVGRSGIELGPFMAIPQVEVKSPVAGQPWEVTLDTPAGVNPAFRFGQVLTEGGYPIWSWMIDGETSGFQLPDVESLAQWSLPSAAGNLFLRIYSVYDPFFEIDQYNNFELNLMDWLSWSIQEVDLDSALP